MKQYKFSDIAELARLKYFGLNDKKELVLKKGLFSKLFHVNKIIDFHSHLGWNYLLSKPINLQVRNSIKHFFPENGKPIDLGHYSALDFDEELKKRCSKETVRSVYSSRGFASTHTIPNILYEMARYRVERVVTLAIDYQVFSKNSDHILDEIPDKKKIIPFVSIHPMSKNKRKLLEKYIAKGAKGVKVHPPMQLTIPTHEGYYELYELCREYNLPILFHTGHSPLTPQFLSKYTKAYDFEKVVKDFPNNVFIFGHGGGVDTYLELAYVAKSSQNVYMEIGSQPPDHINQIVDIVGSKRVLYGSDWPYYPMGVQIAKVLVATEMRPVFRKRIFYSNAQRLINRFQMIS